MGKRRFFTVGGGKKRDSRGRFHSPIGVALAVANVACISHPNSLEGQDVSDPTLLSHQESRDQQPAHTSDSGREINPFNQREVTYEGVVQECKEISRLESCQEPAHQQLEDQVQHFKRERGLFKQEEIRLKILLQTSQETLKNLKIEWRNRENQSREQVSKLESSLESVLSQLKIKSQDLARDRKLFEQTEIKFEQKRRASQKELQLQKIQWTNRENQAREQINRLKSHLESAQKELQLRKTQWTNRENEAREQINRFKSHSESAQKELQFRKTEWTNRENQAREQINRLKSHLDCAQSQLMTKSQELINERELFNQKEIRLEETLQASHARLDTQQAEWAERHCKMIQQFENTHEETLIACETRISQMQKQYANREIALEWTCNEEKQQMRGQHESAMREIGAELESRRMHSELRENDFNLEKIHLEEVHQAKQEELTESFKAHEIQSEQAHKQQQDRWQKDIQSRNKALIARENHSAITDGELHRMFSDLIREVDALARLRWTSNRSPWPDHLLIQISEPSKRLQKQILKDTVWDILFKYIFCSPFRVFEKEGSVLESQWNQAFGKDSRTSNDLYSWPEVSFDAERWRYETMRQSQEALKLDTSEYDPRTKLRKGFQSAIETICAKLHDIFDMVLQIDEKTEQAMEDMVKSAARLCVAFGTQRCRIFLVMKDLKTLEEIKEGSKRQNQPVELLTQPELRRIGDADGQSLDKEQTVAGCEGEMVKFFY